MLFYELAEITLFISTVQNHCPVPFRALGSSCNVSWPYMEYCKVPTFSKKQSQHLIWKLDCKCIVSLMEYGQFLTFEPRSEKSGLQGFRPGSTQTRLWNHRR